MRLVSATNENLQQAIEKGNFREDLYHRINEFTLRMPALKERQEDILLFANFFLDQANRELDRQLIGFDTAASQALNVFMARKPPAIEKYSKTCHPIGTEQLHHPCRIRL